MTRHTKIFGTDHTSLRRGASRLGIAWLCLLPTCICLLTGTACAHEHEDATGAQRVVSHIAGSPTPAPCLASPTCELHECMTVAAVLGPAGTQRDSLQRGATPGPRLPEAVPLRAGEYGRALRAVAHFSLRTPHQLLKGTVLRI